MFDLLIGLKSYKLFDVGGYFVMRFKYDVKSFIKLFGMLE